MSWLERLKTGNAPEKDAAKTTETLFVVSVAPNQAPLQKNAGASAALPEPASVPLCPAMTRPVDRVTVRPPDLSPKLLAASLALDAANAVGGDLPSQDADAHCWPHSTAMNSEEIDLFSARLQRFTDKGLKVKDGEMLADTLVIRDREQDDRHLCLECSHLTGYGSGSWSGSEPATSTWRCGNAVTAGLSQHERHVQLPTDWVMQLQRCDGFIAHRTRPRLTTGDTPTPY